MQQKLRLTTLCFYIDRVIKECREVTAFSVIHVPSTGKGRSRLPETLINFRKKSNSERLSLKRHTEVTFNRQFILTKIIYRHFVYKRKRSRLLRDYLVFTFYIYNVTIRHRLLSFCMKASSERLHGN